MNIEGRIFWAKGPLLPPPVVGVDPAQVRVFLPEFELPLAERIKDDYNYKDDY